MKNQRKAWSSDRELVDRILAGHREDFDLLYESYFPRVYGFALKRLGDPGEAEDIAQTVRVEYDELPPVVDMLAACGSDTPLVHDHWG